MKRNISIGTKPAFAAAACAALTLGMAFSSLAAGWVAEGDEWYYLDNSGYYVTDAWKTSNGYYFYLGDDGAMLTSSLIEDGDNYYYVDENGVRVSNVWVAIAADDDEYEDVSYRWYFFGSTGKAYTDSVNKSINDKIYAFDEEGKMLFGYVDEDGQMVNDSDDPILEATYYFGSNDDGARYSGWLLYEDGLDDDEYDDYDETWFYFSTTNGKKVTDQTKKINGYTYIFDENGVMLYEFVDSDSTSSDYSATSAAGTKYYSGTLGDGSLKKDCWIWAEIPESWGVADDYEDDYHWFRTNTSGYILTSQTKKINSKWYVFDENGVMLSGLVELSGTKVSGSTPVADIDTDEITKDDLIANYSTNIYYFSSDGESDGSMKTGSSIKIELADDTYTFAFSSSSGLAYHGIKDGKVYDHGIRLEADSDEKYEIVTVDGLSYLVSTSGTRQAAGKYYKNGDDEYYVVLSGSDSAGYVIELVDTLDEAKELLG